jgi:hypothetical protein
MFDFSRKRSRQFLLIRREISCNEEQSSPVEKNFAAETLIESETDKI